jgi:HTH-type transcriptional regulator, glycine betaine synthesis regulator
MSAPEVDVGNEFPAAAENFESVAVDAVGNVIEFWGFKRNQGRVWAWLYLHDATLTAAEIERELALSKGGVSMLLKDLERWGVVLRVRLPNDATWRFRAETDLLKMVRRVMEEREFAFISRTRSDIALARRFAESNAQVKPELLARLRRMELLAEATERALKLFLRTSKLDFGGIFDVFRGKSA